MKPRLCRRTLIASFVATTLAASAVLPDRAWAQTAEATLRGHAPPNTEVTASNVDTGLVRRTQADAAGIFSLLGLPPGTYRIVGGGTEATVTLTVDSHATLDLVPSAATGKLAEVTVTGQRLVEVNTSEVSSTVSLHQIENLPQLTRNFLEFADTVPGVTFAVDPQGNTSLRGGAQSTNAVNVYIDGIGQKNYVKEGGVSGQFFTQGNPFPQLAIDEYKVITSNYKAEFDQVQSAAVLAQTRSGTNEFHGEAFGTYTSDHFRAETPSEVAANMKTPSKDKEFGAAIGGPIIQDQLHFFFTYEGKRFTTPITVVPGVSAVNGIAINSLLPASVLAQLGPASLPFSEDLYFGKLDWEPSEADRFELSVKVRREDQIGNIGTSQAQSVSIDTENNDTRLALRWARSGTHYYNDLVFTFEDAYNAPTPINFGNGALYAVHANNDQLVLATGAGDPRSAQDKGQIGPGVQNDFTLSGLQWFGEHTFKTGFKFKYLKLKAQDASDINPQFSYNVTTTGTDTLPYRVLFPDPVPGLDPIARGIDRQFGVYLQDDWVANDHLTLNLGVRWDYESNSAYNDYVTPANVVTALKGQDPNAPAGQTYAQTLGKGGVNINDYISTGSNRSGYTGQIQPRVGFAYDLNADRQHVVFGGYGRSYDRDLFDYLQVERTKAALPLFTYWFQPSCFGQPCIAWDPKYLNGLSNLQQLVAASNKGAEVDLVNNNLRAPYTDMFSIGMRNRLGDWNTSVTFVRTLSYDGFAFTLGNRFPNGAFWMNGGQPWGNGVPGFGSLIIGNNGIETRANQVLIEATKPYTQESGWGTSIAYTFTDATQNRDVTQHYSFDEETIQQYPFIASNAVPKHRLVATGTIRGPWDTIFGGKLTLATPIPVNDVAFYGATFPNGSTGIPIAGRPDNTLGYRSLDLQATKNVQFGKYASAYVRLDVLNVFNWYNYNDYTKNWGANGVPNPNPVTYNYTGNITGPPRTLRLTIGAQF